MAENEKDDAKITQELEAELEIHEEERLENDLAEEQDLNQGMSTGTYETTKSGVDWPASYRVKLTPEEPEKK